jgi:hypothetical protein
MCGIFGGINTANGQVNPAIIRALAIANENRGKHSLGFFDSSGAIVKRAGNPIGLLAKKEFRQFINRAGRWFIAGHTRQATRGSVVDANAHPFQYGRFIGSHNGIVSAPKRFAVDSQYLIYRLDEEKGDYQFAFEFVDGWWGLSWFDGESFYLQAYGNAVALGLHKGAWYYSSDIAHLKACAGALSEVSILEWGDTVKFTPDGKLEWLAPFFSDYGTVTPDYAAIANAQTVDAQTVDDEWERWCADNRDEYRDVWEEYATQFDARW